MWERLSGWWTGSALTSAWESVHQAGVNLIPLERDAELRTTLSGLLAWIQQKMDTGPLRKRHEDALVELIDAPNRKIDRAAVSQAFKDVIVANREGYSNLRAFRNNLIVGIGLLAGLVGLVVVWHLLNSDFMTLCSGEGNATECLDGSSPGATDVALVAIVGAVGGLLANVLRLVETDTVPSRYDPKTWQILLKPVAGAATALAGILLIQADVLIGPPDSHTESLFLSYALLLGFSQQLFTRFVDKRAESLLGTEGDGGGSKSSE